MLGQNFAKAFEVKYLDNNEKQEYVWQTSWGMSTRIIGALIMVHSDDKGLVLPPKIAPIQVVITPIWTNDEEMQKVLEKSRSISDMLKSKEIRVVIDERDERPGVKFFGWEKKGVPVRMEIGPKDLEKQSVVVVRRDDSTKELVSNENITEKVMRLLGVVQSDMFSKANKFMEDNTRPVDSWEDFKDTLEKKSGFLLAHWCGDGKCEEKIKEETKATIRCIPFNQPDEEGGCVLCGGKSKKRVIFAKAY
jgi:prolyl-tRNA synthetase